MKNRSVGKGHKFNVENARVCPFRKYTRTIYDTVGPHYTPGPIETTEDFEICIGDQCMLYLYDAFSDTEQCLLGRKPYEI